MFHRTIGKLSKRDVYLAPKGLRRVVFLKPGYISPWKPLRLLTITSVSDVIKPEAAVSSELLGF